MIAWPSWWSGCSLCINSSPEVGTPHEKTALQRRIEATDGQIDVLVYELYGLTEEEVRIVEAASGKKKSNEKLFLFMKQNLDRGKE